MTDRPRYADKAARDKMYRTTNWTPLICELCAALDYLDARLNEAVAREAVILSVLEDARNTLMDLKQSDPKPVAFPEFWNENAGGYPGNGARALMALHRLSGFSDAARDFLEKARNYDALGDESVLKLLVAERDSLRADAEKHANRNIQLVEILDNVKRENAALRDKMLELHRTWLRGDIRSEDWRLAQLDAPEKPCERAGCTNGFGGCKHV